MAPQTPWARPFRGVRLVLVMAAVLAVSPTFVGAFGPVYNIVFNTNAYVLYQDAPTSAVSLTAANEYCMDKGMNIFSSETPLKDNTFASTSYAQTGRVGAMSYVGTSAEPNAEFSKTCSKVKQEYGVPNGAECLFTLRYGLFTISLFIQAAYQVGSLQYKGLYSSFKSSGNQLAGYDINWEKLTGENPNGGYFAVSHAVNATYGAHLNADATVPSINVADTSNMMIFCESQAYLGYPPLPTVLTQPSFVKGYKEDTWAQAHWWVIFLIVAIVILIILFAILIYCCLTMAPPKEEPPIAPMVMREREGAPYINGSDEDSSSKPRSMPRASVNQGDASVQSAPAPMQQPPSFVMVPVPIVDPEDLIQATPSVFSQEETMQTTEGDSRASEDEESSESRSSGGR